MTINEIAERIKGRVIVPCGANVTEYYAGDFLSRVMGNAPSNSAWFTVMTSLNVAGVASLADIKIVILCEGVVPTDDLVARCRSEGIGLIATELPLYESCVGVT